MEAKDKAMSEIMKAIRFKTTPTGSGQSAVKRGGKTRTTNAAMLIGVNRAVMLQDKSLSEPMQERIVSFPGVVVQKLGQEGVRPRLSATKRFLELASRR